MTFVDRNGAVTFIAQNARGLIDVPTARQIAQACGVDFDALLFIDAQLVQEPGTAKKAWAVEPVGFGRALVQVSDLGAAICRYMGLYANSDHAKAAPHGTPGRNANYIGKRAAIRLAREFWPDGSGLRDLLRDVPDIAKAGVAHTIKDKDGHPILGPDGKPITRGADALLIEQPYKV